MLQKSKRNKKRLLILPVSVLAVSFLVFSALTVQRFFVEMLAIPDTRTRSWQTVYVDYFGSFRVPTEWTVEQDGRAIYITDKPRQYSNYAIYFVGYLWEEVRGAARETSIYEDENADISHPIPQPPELFNKVGVGSFVRGQVLGNAARLSLFSYNIDGREENFFEIRAGHFCTNYVFTFRLLVWNQDIPLDDLIDITKTVRWSR